jgi:8-oxo-dGTP pyrophosphatase MutT (NUDIX family)
MPISPYLRRLRDLVGRARLVVPSVTALVHDDAGRVLLVRHADRGVWVMPGGAIEPDETPADAVVRETAEETGLRVEPVAIAGVFGGPAFLVRYANGDETNYVMTVFACRTIGGTPRPDGDETLDVRFVARDAVAGLDVAPWVPIVLAAVGDGRAPAAFAPPAGR